MLEIASPKNIAMISLLKHIQQHYSRQLNLLPGLVLLSTIAAIPAQAVPTEPSSSEMVPRQLVLRLLKCPSDCLQEMDLLIGRLPANLPVELPIPNNAKVLATLIRRATYSEIVLDVPQSAAQIRAFYRDRLKTAGWKPVGITNFSQPGFLTSDQESGILASNLSFCKGSAGPQISVAIDAEENAPTDVRLYLDTSAEACVSEAAEADTLTQLRQSYPIPSLEAPPNVKVTSANLGDSGQNVISTAQIETKLGSAPLHDAYAQQLTQAGWTKTTVEQGRVGGWSWWSLKNAEGQTWKGLLTFTPIEGAQNQYAGVFLLIKQETTVSSGS